jgi:hypothetical protein
MSDIAGADDLIATARESLLRDVLPALPKDRRYAALMIANAMAIASREAIEGVAAAAWEAEQLGRLLARAGDAQDGSHATPARLPALRQAMKEAIRAGRFDALSDADAISTSLLEVTRARVAISNPKALRPDEIRPAEGGS